METTRTTQSHEVTSKDIIIYTDGSAKWQDRMGGLGVYIQQGEKEWFYSRHFENTSIGRMELLGIYCALKLIQNKKAKIRIICDSLYAVTTYNKWGRTNDKSFYTNNAKNTDIIEQIQQIMPDFTDLVIEWCKGHSGIIGNEITDFLASKKNFEEGDTTRIYDSQQMTDFMKLL